MSSIGEPVMERGISIPRIVRDNGFCLTCRRAGKQCDSTLPICRTCQDDGLECIQPISAYPRAQSIPAKRQRDSSESPEERPRARLRPASLSPAAVEPPVEPEPEPESEPESEAETEILTPSASEPQSEAEAETEAEILTPSAAEPQPESETEILTPSTPRRQSEAETEILTPSAPRPQYEPARQTRPQPQPQPQLQENEDNENSTSGPGWSVFLNAITREIDQAQQSLLRQTQGHVQFSMVPGPHNDDPDHDPDHDYAVYYDYLYDLDSDSDSDSDSEDEEDDVGGPDGDGSQSSAPSTSETRAPTPPTVIVYQIRDTWTGEGAPPLMAYLHDFIDYMGLCHLSHAPSDSLPLSLLPASEPTTAETLRYYVLRPLNRGTMPLPDINPTNPKVVDLAYSNPLALQLIIAERANHREVSSARLPTGQIAEEFYRAAIGAFAPKIRSYLNGNEEDMLSLTMGSLILALMEKARLDRRGRAPNYPSVAGRILIMLSTLPHEEVCDNLPDILIEYYMHTAMFACLAADITTAETIPFVSSAFQDAVDGLVARNYNGTLCGTWLPIMVSIHNIFTLGMAMRPYVNGPLGIPRPGPSVGYLSDHFVTFGRIQEKLFNFAPALDEFSADFEAAVVWRNAAMLYLWSLLEWPNAPKPNGPYSEMIHNAYHDAIRRLGQIDREHEVNKTISWPLLVVGCFAIGRNHQEYIGSRLLDISARFKVGNALETYFILKHVWTLAPVWRSPWLLRRSIRETQSWGTLEPNRFL